MSGRTMVYANLAHKAGALQRMASDLCDRCEDAECYAESTKVAQAAALLADVAGNLETAARASLAGKAHTRWTAIDDDFLASRFGPAMRATRGDAEAAVAQLAADLKRTPVAVAARLVKTGVWS